MADSEKKTKKWWQHLLIIPIMALIDVVFLFIAALLDSSMPSGSQVGHPMPAITIIIAFILAAVTVVLVIRGVVLAIKSAIPKKQKEENDVESVPSEETKQKPVWMCFLPLIIQLAVSVVLLIVCGSSEINAFYNKPDHIGFAVPIVTFMLFGILLILAVITLVITLIVVKKRYSGKGKTAQ